MMHAGFALSRFTAFALVAACFLLAAAASARAETGEACVEGLRDPDVATIACDMAFVLPERERTVMTALTAGILRDASCVANVSVGREPLVRAVLREDLLAVPSQPVGCEVVTDGPPITARFTLAPKLWFADGKAVRASPGMDNLKGVPALLGRLITDWVNKSPDLEDAILDAVNDYIENGLR